jgi:hypothetical protein
MLYQLSYLAARTDFRVYRGADSPCNGLFEITPESDKLQRHVIYIFEKERQGALRLETRYARDSRTYEIIWRRADGTTTKETFNGEMSFRSRLHEIQVELEDEEWQTVGPPHLLADGWKI